MPLKMECATYILRAIINMVLDNNTTVIISSHSLRELEDICDCYGLLDNKYIISSGNIDEQINKIHKYQIAFNEVYEREDFDIDFIKFSRDGRVIKIVVKENIDDITTKLSKYNPLIIDEIAIDFEELFIIEVEARGYFG